MSEPVPFRAEHGQAAYRVRFDWGLSGARAIAAAADVVVVVDVLSFTTALSVAADAGTTVLPFPSGDVAAEHARANGAVLAGRRSGGGPSLSPATLRGPVHGGRLVLPTPNGSTIAFELRDARGVVGASLRTAELTARWVHAWTAPGAVVAVVAAGERWPDGSVRPAVVSSSWPATRRTSRSPPRSMPAPGCRCCAGTPSSARCPEDHPVGPGAGPARSGVRAGGASLGAARLRAAVGAERRRARARDR